MFANPYYPHAISVFLTSTVAAEALAHIRHSVIERDTFQAFKKVISLDDLVFSEAVAKHLNQDVFFKDLTQERTLADLFCYQNQEDCVYIEGVIKKMADTPEQTHNAAKFLLSEETYHTDNEDECSCYKWYKYGSVMVVGVEQSFYRHVNISHKARLHRFYVDGLELCRDSLMGNEVLSSPLYGQFVKSTFSH